MTRSMKVYKRLREELLEERKVKKQLEDELYRTKAVLGRKLRLASKQQELTSLIDNVYKDCQKETVNIEAINREQEFCSKMDHYVKQLRSCEAKFHQTAAMLEKLTKKYEEIQNVATNQASLIKQLEALNSEKSSEIKKLQQCNNESRKKSDFSTSCQPRYVSSLKRSIAYGGILLERNAPLTKKEKLWISNAKIWLEQLGEKTLKVPILEEDVKYNESNNKTLQSHSDFGFGSAGESELTKSKNIEQNSAKTHVDSPSSSLSSWTDEGISSPQMSVISQLSTFSEVSHVSSAISSLSNDSGLVIDQSSSKSNSWENVKKSDQLNFKLNNSLEDCFESDDKNIKHCTSSDKLDSTAKKEEKSYSLPILDDGSDSPLEKCHDKDEKSVFESDLDDKVDVEDKKEKRVTSLDVMLHSPSKQEIKPQKSIFDPEPAKQGFFVNNESKDSYVGSDVEIDLKVGGKKGLELLKLYSNHELVSGNASKSDAEPDVPPECIVSVKPHLGFSKIDHNASDNKEDNIILDKVIHNGKDFEVCDLGNVVNEIEISLSGNGGGELDTNLEDSVTALLNMNEPNRGSDDKCMDYSDASLNVSCVGDLLEYINNECEESNNMVESSLATSNFDEVIFDSERVSQEVNDSGLKNVEVTGAFNEECNKSENMTKELNDSEDSGSLIDKGKLKEIIETSEPLSCKVINYDTGSMKLLKYSSNICVVQLEKNVTDLKEELRDHTYCCDLTNINEDKDCSCKVFRKLLPKQTEQDSTKFCQNCHESVASSSEAEMGLDVKCDKNINRVDVKPSVISKDKILFSEPESADSLSVSQLNNFYPGESVFKDSNNFQSTSTSDCMLSKLSEIEGENEELLSSEKLQPYGNNIIKMSSVNSKNVDNCCTRKENSYLSNNEESEKVINGRVCNDVKEVSNLNDMECLTEKSTNDTEIPPLEEVDNSVYLDEGSAADSSSDFKSMEDDIAVIKNINQHLPPVAESDKFSLVIDQVEKEIENNISNDENNLITKKSLDEEKSSTLDKKFSPESECEDMEMEELLSEIKNVTSFNCTRLVSPMLQSPGRDRKEKISIGNSIGRRGLLKQTSARPLRKTELIPLNGRSRCYSDSTGAQENPNSSSLKGEFNDKNKLESSPEKSIDFSSCSSFKISETDQSEIGKNKESVSFNKRNRDTDDLLLSDIFSYVHCPPLISFPVSPVNGFSYQSVSDNEVKGQNMKVDVITRESDLAIQESLCNKSEMKGKIIDITNKKMAEEDQIKYNDISECLNVVGIDNRGIEFTVLNEVNVVDGCAEITSLHSSLANRNIGLKENSTCREEFSSITKRDVCTKPFSFHTRSLRKSKRELIKKQRTLLDSDESNDCFSDSSDDSFIGFADINNKSSVQNELAKLRTFNEQFSMLLANNSSFKKTLLETVTHNTIVKALIGNELKNLDDFKLSMLKLSLEEGIGSELHQLKEKEKWVTSCNSNKEPEKTFSDDCSTKLEEMSQSEGNKIGFKAKATRSVSKCKNNSMPDGSQREVRNKSTPSEVGSQKVKSLRTQDKKEYKTAVTGNLTKVKQSISIDVNVENSTGDVKKFSPLRRSERLLLKTKKEMCNESIEHEKNSKERNNKKPKGMQAESGTTKEISQDVILSKKQECEIEGSKNNSKKKIKVDSSGVVSEFSVSSESNKSKEVQIKNRKSLNAKLPSRGRRKSIKETNNSHLSCKFCQNTSSPLETVHDHSHSSPASHSDSVADRYPIECSEKKNRSLVCEILEEQNTVQNNGKNKQILNESFYVCNLKNKGNISNVLKFSSEDLSCKMSVKSTPTAENCDEVGLKEKENSCNLLVRSSCPDRRHKKDNLTKILHSTDNKLPVNPVEPVLPRPNKGGNESIIEKNTYSAESYGIISNDEPGSNIFYENNLNDKRISDNTSLLQITTFQHSAIDVAAKCSDKKGVAKLETILHDKTGNSSVKDKFIKKISYQQDKNLSIGSLNGKKEFSIENDTVDSPSKICSKYNTSVINLKKKNQKNKKAGVKLKYNLENKHSRSLKVVSQQTSFDNSKTCNLGLKDNHTVCSHFVDPSKPLESGDVGENNTSSSEKSSKFLGLSKQLNLLTSTRVKCSYSSANENVSNCRILDDKSPCPTDFVSDCDTSSNHDAPCIYSVDVNDVKIKSKFRRGRTVDLCNSLTSFKNSSSSRSELKNFEINSDFIYSKNCSNEVVPQIIKSSTVQPFMNQVQLSEETSPSSVVINNGSADSILNNKSTSLLNNLHTKPLDPNLKAQDRAVVKSLSDLKSFKLSLQSPLVSENFCDVNVVCQNNLSLEKNIYESNLHSNAERPESEPKNFELSNISDRIPLVDHDSREGSSLLFDSQNSPHNALSESTVKSSSNVNKIPSFNFYINISDVSDVEKETKKRKLSESDENEINSLRSLKKLRENHLETSSDEKRSDFNKMFVSYDDIDQEKIACCNTILHTAFSYHKPLLIAPSEKEDAKLKSKEVRDCKMVESVLGVVQGLCTEDKPLTDQLLNNTLHQLKSCEQKSVAEMFIDLLCIDKEDVIEGSVPPLTPLQRYLLPVAYHLSCDSAYPDFLSTFVRCVKATLFSNTEKCLVLPSQNLARFSTVLCRSLQRFSDMRWFIYDVLYMLRYRSTPIIHSILTLWPSLMPFSYNIKDCPLSFCISHIITNQNTKSRYAKLYKDLDIKLLMKSYYQYKPGVMKNDQAFENLLKFISNKGFTEAVILLCKREGCDWTITKINQIFLPMLESWRNGIVDEATATIVVTTLGYVLRPFPRNAAEKITYDVVTQLEKILINLEGSSTIQEAAAVSICHLSRLNFEFCINVLQKWKPKNSEVSKSVIETMKFMIGMKKPVWWQKYLAGSFL